MTESPHNVAPAGWFVDPMTHRHLRWWNGQAWTESVAPLPGVAPTAYVAPAPQVQRRFAIESTTTDTPAASSTTASSTGAARPFIHQVPEAVVQPAQPEPVAAQPDVSPAIPWPAVQPAAEVTGTYQPNYNTYAPNFDSASTPSFARSSFVPAEQQKHAAQHAAQQAAAQQAALQFAMPPAEPVQQAAVAPQYAPVPVEQPAAAAAATSVDLPLSEMEPTLMSRRQLRDRQAAESAVASSAPRSTATAVVDHADVWAGHDDRGDRVAETNSNWSAIGSPRSTRNQPAVAIRWSTASVWLLTVTPWLGLAAVIVALAFFEAWSLPAFGVLLLPYLFTLLFAQQDASKLRDLGHERPARAAWALLTAPIYLMMRTIVLERTAGVGTPPIWIWLANLAVVVGGCSALALMPGIAPGYLVEFAEPLRATATAWLTPPF